ncbi:MGMT family protein [Pontibacillus yanchengensis]|uniref:MGMT family protein n=1 Tax=Pontibacillus yanchengensis TaxID=462910 RepID=UPI00301DD03F
MSFGDKKTYTNVANANGTNQLAIIVLCHRAIKENGDLAKYGGGLHRKNGYWNMKKKEVNRVS